MRKDGKITVFLLDDLEIARRGVRELLSAEDGIEVVGESGTAADALVRIPATRPDVAVLDVRLPDGSGVQVCREIRSRNENIKCLMLTSFADDEALFDAIMAGASGYALKAIRGSELLTAVRDVAAGRSLLDPAAVARVRERLRLRGGSNSRSDDRLDDRLDDKPSDLTEQERRILDLIGEGLTDRAIGERLHLAERTIKNCVSGLLCKLGREQRSEAAAYGGRMQAERPHP
ncbi:response regulator transcription factor [Streptomyces sp. NBC_01142]|uniref:response regulator transcription factor n=1 Tax=Streptomyces sp. NBC_01142 TaxID=2975865 RepID=UPI002B1D8177|nr:response regulator transcription factor [Streptomyces sp. NBC_01142]